MTELTYPEGFENAPFNVLQLWSKKKNGKTIAAINSPWRPVHVLDTEYSSEFYFEHQERLIKEKILAGNFTRVDCLSQESAFAETLRIKKEKEMYGTIVIDTSGQLFTWMADFVWAEAKPYEIQTQTQILWGRVRNNIRNLLIGLIPHCKLLILTAHEREYNKVKSARSNQAAEELTDLSLRLVRYPNKPVPYAEVYGGRIPWLPPKIDPFYIRKLLDYFDAPADWNNLEEDQMIEEDLHSVEIPPEEGLD